MASIVLSVVTLICDGMDQAKFKTPRLANGARHAKMIEALFRVTLHVVCCWAHGAVLALYVADEDLKKDSETQIEIISRTLEMVYVSKGLPLGMHLQQDNCSREGKNTFLFAFCVSLVVRGVFRFASLGFLRTGHSRPLSCCAGSFQERVGLWGCWVSVSACL